MNIIRCGGFSKEREKKKEENEKSDIRENSNGNVAHRFAIRRLMLNNLTFRFECFCWFRL